MSLPPNFWTLNIWDSEAKTTLKTGPVTNVTRVTRQRVLMGHHQYEVDLILEDKAVGTIQKGWYVELQAGWTSPVLWLNGLVQTVAMTEGEPGGITLSIASAGLKLHDFSSLGALVMKYGKKDGSGRIIYNNVLDSLNGRSNTPGQQGILTGSNWVFRMVDQGGYVASISLTGGGSGYSSPPTVTISGGGGSGAAAMATISGGVVNGLVLVATGANYTGTPTVSFSGGGGGGATGSVAMNNLPAMSTTTSGGTVVPGDVQATVGTTTGMTNGHLVKMGNDYYQITQINSGTSFSFAPPSYGTYTAGTAVIDTNRTMPGRGDSWESDNSPAFEDVLIQCQSYGMYVREKSGGQTNSGTLEGGTLNDVTSGAIIWGGFALADHQGRASAQYGYEPDYSAAQASGLAIIEHAEYSEDLTNVINLIWPIGKGEGKSLITLFPLVGGAPTGNGWTSWTPDGVGGRQYYVKAASKTTYQGNTYEFVASQRNDGTWEYGVVDRTSVSTFGLHEQPLPEKTINSADWLLSAALGHLEYLSDPVPQWTFSVFHPLTSANGTPNLPNPGEQAVIYYSGQVRDSTIIDTNTAHDSYGQPIDNGAYTYMTFPGPWATSGQRLQKAERIVEIDDEWDGDQFVSTYVLGRSKWHSKHVTSALAKQMEKNVKNKNRKHSFHKQQFDHVWWWFSQNPDAEEDSVNNLVTMEIGSNMVSAMPDATFFSDHHTVSFTCSFTDAGVANYLDIQLAKPINGNLTSPNAGATYLVYRLAQTNSGVTTGFKTTSDGSTMTVVGQNHVNPHIDKNGHISNGTYRVLISLAGHQFKAQLAKADANGIFQHADVATWNDTGAVITTMGALGFYLRGGNSALTLWDLHAQPVHHKSAAKGGISTPHMRNTHHTRKRNRLTSAQYSVGTGGIAGQAGRLVELNGIGRLAGALKP